MWHDLRVGSRTLRRSPGFTALAVVTLALGIGLVTAMGAVLNGTVWHPLPFPEADRLVSVGGAVSRASVADWQRTARSFDGLAGYRGRAYTLTGTGAAVSLRATVASGSLFSVLRTDAAAGRVFSPHDDVSLARVAVLSHVAWRDLFQSDPAVVGRTISLNRVDFVVVGVMPRNFQFPTNAARMDVYTTIAGDAQTDKQQAGKGRPRDLQVLGRLGAGVSLDQARAEMSAIGHRSDEGGNDRKAPVAVVRLADQISATLVSPLTVLAWAVACVLFIACATVSVLLLIRVTDRRKEMATRLAIGASRLDIARQCLVESLLIGLGGAVLGTVFAMAGANVLLVAAGSNIRAVARAQFDWRALGLAAGATCASVLLVGMVPAMHAAAVQWPELLRDGTRRTRSGPRIGSLVLVAEIALTVALVAVCLTLAHTYTELSAVDPGFDARDALTFRLDLSDALYTVPQQAQFFDRVRTEASRLPGARSTAFAALLPFGDLRFTMRIDAPGRPPGDTESAGAEVFIVSPGFFRAMGIPLLGGRDFDEQDRVGTAKVAVISAALARRCFGDADPLGRALDTSVGPSDDAEPKLHIVAVAGDVRNGSLAVAAEPQLYVPYAQAPLIPSATFVARLSSPAAAGTVLAAIRDRVHALDPSVPLVEVKPLDDYVHATLVQQRFNTFVAGTFGVSAVLLTMAGLYAVVAYSAARRRKEFAIRMAVGAGRRTIAWLVVKDGLAAVVPGVLFGIAAAAAARRALASVLYGVQPNEAAVLLVAGLTCAAVALIATWQPAYAATRQDLRATLQSSV